MQRANRTRAGLRTSAPAPVATITVQLSTVSVKPRRLVFASKDDSSIGTKPATVMRTSATLRGLNMRRRDREKARQGVINANRIALQQQQQSK